MRIIAGHFRGTRLFAPAGADIRPTADRLRESIFNILQGRIHGKRILDLYAGTGALGIEALSRGARQAVFIDNDPGALDLVRRNITKVRAAEQATIIRWDISHNLHCLDRSEKFDLVFMDPPYGKGLVGPTMAHLSAAGCSVGMIVAEHEASEKVAAFPAGFFIQDQRRYGKTLVSFFRPVV